MFAAMDRASLPIRLGTLRLTNLLLFRVNSEKTLALSQKNADPPFLEPAFRL